MDSACGMYERDVYSLLIGKLEDKKLPGRPRYGWQGDINVVLKEIVFCRALIGFIRLRIGTGSEFLCVCGIEPSVFTNCGEFIFSRALLRAVSYQQH